METHNFLDTIIHHIGSAMMTIIGQGILFAAIGLVTAILFINYGRRRRWFNRSFGLWTFVAKLNYLYLPVLFVVFGGSAGILSGVHSAAGDIVDAASGEFIKHGQETMMQIQDMVVHSKIEIAGMTAQDLVDAHLKAQDNLGYFSGIVVRACNMMFVRHCFKKMGATEALNDPFAMGQAFSSNNFTTAVLSIPSMAVHAHLDYIFIGFFMAMCAAFSTFFFLPLAEFGLHLLVSSMSGNSGARAEWAV